jgi:hypothetical protein
MPYLVEPNIPIPNSPHATPRRRGFKEPKLYPFDEMLIGDSFIVPCTRETYLATSNRLTNAASNRAKGTSERYTTRLVAGGIRVWRIT